MRRVCNTTCVSRANNFAAQKKIFSSGLPVVWLLVLAVISPCLYAQNNSPTMSVGRPVAFAVSAPLRDLASALGSKGYVLPAEDPVAIPGFYPGALGLGVDPVEQSSPGGESNI